MKAKIKLKENYDYINSHIIYGLYIYDPIKRKMVSLVGDHGVTLWGTKSNFSLVKLSTLEGFGRSNESDRIKRK